MVAFGVTSLHGKSRSRVVCSGQRSGRLVQVLANPS